MTAEAKTDGSGSRLEWLDRLKAVAMAWIFANHAAEAMFGYPLIANPTADWPPLAERIAQLQPQGGHGVWSIPLDLFRYVGWSGDQGVQLFLLVSGFGLTWGLLRTSAGDALPLGRFYRRRLGRIYPEWLTAHALVAAFVVATGLGHVSLKTLALSAAGIRFLPELFYAISPAWWYVGLLLQLYLVFPLLWRLLHRYDAKMFLAGTCAVAIAVRAAGLLTLEDYLDPWHRGALFITRLPEFALGMAIAAVLHRHGAGFGRVLRSGRTLLGAVAAYALGTAASLTLLGMAVAPLLLCWGAFVVLQRLLAAIEGSRGPGARGLDWLGRHTYSVFLVHYSMIALFVPLGQPASVRSWAGLAAAVAATGVAALLLERLAALPGTMFRLATRVGWSRAGVTLGAGLVVVATCAVAVELAVRRIDPQEAFGWGERPSLRPHPEFGWTLEPASSYRLRWESYDYTMTSNDLGFPAPGYDERRPAQGLRILATGDAFTSAEGVDTPESWPRRLEAELRSRHPETTVEVLNFGITGYGPNQYAAVVREFAPRFRPDLVLVGFFVNEFEDVLTDTEAFHASIGFGKPPPDGFVSIASLAHARRLARLRLGRWRKEWVLGIPHDHAYFLGNFRFLERRDSRYWSDGRSEVRQRLAEIVGTADDVGARVVLLLIPAPAQVCTADELAYYPAHVDLADRERFDVDRPQRAAREIAEELGVTTFDLAPVLRDDSGRCLYQPRNMHWLETGHARVAGAVADRLSEWMPARQESNP